MSLVSNENYIIKTCSIALNPLKSKFQVKLYFRFDGHMWIQIADKTGDNDAFDEFTAIDITEIRKAQPGQFHRALLSISELKKVFDGKGKYYKGKDFISPHARLFYLNCLASFYGYKYGI